MTNQRTSAPPRVVSGVTFRCYRTGILRYEWRDDAGRLAAGSRPNKLTYYAAVDGVRLPTRFRSLNAAMVAAVKRA